MKQNDTIEITNQHISIATKSIGAEWCSLIDHKTDTQLLWEANPNYWGRHSCILFPFIGRLKDGKYQYNGRRYHSDPHGFLRDRTFTISHHGAHTLAFRYQSDQDDLEVYPFPFAAEINYRLIDSTVEIEYIIKNEGDQTMFFSLGGHPGFTCPITAGKKRSDYRLELSENETAYTLRIDDSGLIGTEKDIILNQERTIPITDNLFDNDALVFHKLKSNQLTLIDDEDRKIWTFDFSGFSHLGIWSKNRESPFICIEPWYGLADYGDHDYQLEHKIGICRLQPGDTFEAVHKVTVH